MGLDWVQKTLRLRLGFTAYPGTLNVRPDQPVGMAQWERIRRGAGGVEIAPPDASFCRALCFRMEVTAPSASEKIPGAVILPEVENYPADKIEIIAAVNIKHSLGVGDGDRLTLKFF